MTPISGSFGGTFGFPSIQKSKTVHGNGLTVTAARLTATFTGTVQFALGTSPNPDGTSITFENVTSGVAHTFITTGEWIYWSAVGNPGSIVTKIEIDQITES